MSDPEAHVDTSQPALAGARPRRQRSANPFAGGEPMVWLTGGSVAAALIGIVGLLAFIAWNGFANFWPAPLPQIKVRTAPGDVNDPKNHRLVMGEPAREETYRPEGSKDEARRILYKTGNFDLTGSDFTWVPEPNVVERTYPRWAMVIERVGWHNAYGILEGAIVEGKRIEGAEAAWRTFNELHEAIRERVEEIRRIEKGPMGDIAHEQNELRIALRGVAMRHGQDSAEYRATEEQNKTLQTELDARMASLRERTRAIWSEVERARLIVRTPEGQIVPADRGKPDEPMFFWQVVRAYPANQLDLGGKLSVYASRWWEFLADEPREANTEGGVFPAIFGTVLLTLIMIILVVPLGVIAAIYLREYARQGLVLSIVRISVNNLAGVPSIIFGVFGLGFFCYLIGGSIDQWFFSERLPDPTVGKSAMIWASLTLALLTLPVVVVATEEALAAVPRSMREGSYACGASKWQTIRRIVLPRAMPGIMTGMILAIARGAGEVAPLMLVGVIKHAPDLPVNGRPPFFGTNQSFMHLGYHLFDLGFQSRNSEAAQSMVFTTTFLLILIVVLLNLAAMLIRTRLRKAYAGGQF